MGKANRCSLAAEKIQTQYESLKVACETVEKQNELLNDKIDALLRDMEQLTADIFEVKGVVEREEEMTEPATEAVSDIKENDVLEENNG
jgi:predicted  nucleic acid-binding Zn-ribbon protein